MVLGVRTLKTKGKIIDTFISTKKIQVTVSKSVFGNLCTEHTIFRGTIRIFLNFPPHT